MDNSVVLSVGDVLHLRFGKDRIVYAGMPSERVYSIVQRKWEFMYRGFAWNLFLSQRAKQNKNRRSQYLGGERYSR